jgi:hypothetical protein
MAVYVRLWYYYCIFCPGRRLQPDPHDDTKLMCFSYRYFVPIEDAPNEEDISVKHGQQPTKIVSVKTKRNYYDPQGNEINDPDLIDEIQRDANVISNHEEKPQ